MYRILKQEGRAKRAEFHTVHGVIQTPVFMNVGTVAAIKGAVATSDLEQIGTQVELSNTYHLHPAAGRTSPFYVLGQAYSHGFRRIPGVFFSRTAQNPGRGSLF